MPVLVLAMAAYFTHGVMEHVESLVSVFSHKKILKVDLNLIERMLAVVQTKSLQAEVPTTRTNLNPLSRS